MRLSIRYKILAVTGLLLLLAVGSYTLLASFIFMEQKTALVYEINHSTAVNTAAQLRSALLRISDQAKLHAISQLLSRKNEWRLPSRSLRDNYVLTMGVYRKQGGRFTAERLGADIPRTGLEVADLQAFLEQAMQQDQVFWRMVRDRGNDRFFLASRMDLYIGGREVNYVSVAELDPKPFFETLHNANLFDSFLMKPTGEVLLHVRDRQELPPQSAADHPLVAAFAGERTSGVQSYRYADTQWYGAYAPVGIADLIFISQADRSEVTSALAVLLRRSLLFGLIVVTIAFIASILFSKSLTRNLQQLTERAAEIGRGDLNSHLQVRSGDEVETLATSFNKMVDELRASREAIERYNQELERKVELRTQQLRETNAAIKAVQEKLLQTTQLAAVGEVAGQTAHELLNPLTAILSRVERSRQSVEAPATGANPVEQLDQILQAWNDDFAKGGIPQLVRALEAPSKVAPGKSLLEEDLENLGKLSAYWKGQTGVLSADLDFVRDQAGRIHRIVDQMRKLIRSSDKSVVACRKATEEAVATLSDFMAKHGVTLHLDWIAPQDSAELNRDELIQILTNLLRNAYQAITSAGRPGTITLQATNHGPLLAIDVTDNGAGIAPEHKGRLFEQGFTTKGPADGTGLGLAICRRYARAFGGEVELLFSEPQGRGTCFRVTIPLKGGDSAA